MSKRIEDDSPIHSRYDLCTPTEVTMYVPHGCTGADAAASWCLEAGLVEDEWKLARSAASILPFQNLAIRPSSICLHLHFDLRFAARRAGWRSPPLNIS